MLTLQEKVWTLTYIITYHSSSEGLHGIVFRAADNPHVLNRMTLTIQGPGAEVPVCLLCPNLSATNRYRPETGQETKSDHFLSCFLPQQVSGTASKVLVKSVPPQRSTTIAAMSCQPAIQGYSRSLQALWTPATASCHLKLRW